MAVVGERVESDVDVVVGAQILGARTIFGEGQTPRLDAVRRKARQQSLAVTARRRQELGQFLLMTRSEVRQAPNQNPNETNPIHGGPESVQNRRFTYTSLHPLEDWPD